MSKPIGTGVFYPENIREHVIYFTDRTLSIELDGQSIRIETDGINTADDERPFGSAGVAIEMDAADARAMAKKILDLTD